MSESFDDTNTQFIPYSRPTQYLGGCYKEPKKWTKPKVEESPPTSPRKITSSLKYGDWVNHSSQETSSPLYRKKSVRHSFRPEPIKIDGAKPIKDSPFFH